MQVRDRGSVGRGFLRTHCDSLPQVPAASARLGDPSGGDRRPMAGCRTSGRQSLRATLPADGMLSPGRVTSRLPDSQVFPGAQIAGRTATPAGERRWGAVMGAYCPQGRIESLAGGCRTYMRQADAGCFLLAQTFPTTASCGGGRSGPWHGEPALRRTVTAVMHLALS